MSEDRDEDTGQFVPSTEGLFGQAALEAEGGYKPMTVANPVKAPDDEFSVSEREAADAYASVDEEAPIVPVEYFDVGTGNLRDPRETVSLEQAAHDYANWESSNADFAEFGVGSDFAAQVDALREQAANDPKLAEHYGLEKTDDAAKPADLRATEDPAATTAPVDGLDPEVSKALAHPQIRQAIESELAETHKVREAYSSNLQQSQQMLQGVIASLAPDLQGVPLERWGEAIQLMAQVDPVRAQLVGDALGKWSTIQQAAQQDQQHQAWAAKQQFDAFAKSEDARFRTMVDHSPENMQKIGTEMVSYFSELGISQDELANQLRTNPLMRSAAGQKVIYDAVQARLAAKEAATWRDKASRSVPPVQRPGTTAPRASSGTDLDSIFAKNPTLKNAQRAYAARSKG